MTKILQGTLDRAVLNKLFELTQSTVTDKLDADEIARLFDFDMSQRRVEMSLDQLEQDGMIQGTFSSLADSTYEIGRLGYLAVEQGRQLDDSFDRLYAEFGDSWLEETGGSDTSESTGVGGSDRAATSVNEPSSDTVQIEVPTEAAGTYGASAYGESVYGGSPSRRPDIGAFQSGGKSIGAVQASADEADEGAPIPASDRVVTLDHNSHDYKEAIEGVDDLRELVRGNNEFAAENPGEHSQMVSELSAIRELLEAQQISPSRIEAFAWGTFAYLIEKFADGPISAAADLAWKALSQLLGFG